MEQTATLRLLMIDDELLFLKSCSRYFERKGFHVWAESNALEALDRLAAAPDAIDVVLLDYSLSELTGAECMDRIAEIRADLPVVLLSAYPADTFDDKRISRAAKILTKPIELPVLTEIIRQL